PSWPSGMGWFTSSTTSTYRFSSLITQSPSGSSKAMISNSAAPYSLMTFTPNACSIILLSTSEHISEVVIQAFNVGQIVLNGGYDLRKIKFAKATSELEYPLR